ncbi:MAG TPA: MoxR family ATPase [Candidatus Dormibacteraeota bacterium]|nr:MoxR family ATPase [Candidatus Dormibacteraeota bacterium]
MPHNALPPMDAERFTRRFEEIQSNVERVIKGKRDVIHIALVALFSEGHVLFEDAPGVGKSMLARSISRTISAEVGRIQCTPDMLPGDITGSSILDQARMTFTFRPGPVFANILLADEINRATPKTQSALLEAMAERSVTVEGTTHALPRPFLVLATQNPIELAGTFPLPEAQLDRFLFKLAIGYPDADAEEQVLLANGRQPAIDRLQPVVDLPEVVAMVEWASGVTVAQPVMRYVIDIVQATRNDAALALGASPRASLALLWAARVLAASQGREDVYPDDVKTLLHPVMSHRLVLSPEAQLRGETVDKVLERVVGRVKPPLVSSSSPRSAGHREAFAALG